MLESVVTSMKSAKIGVMPANEDIPAGAFAGRFPRTSLVCINLNQYGPQQLRDCVPYVAGLGRQVVTSGRTPFWSVPMPGARAVEAVNEGIYDDLYTAIGDAIVAVQPGASTIYVRPPWEFGLAWQENAALDRSGKANAKLYTRAWRRISALLRAGAPGRIRIVWCPAVDSAGEVVKARDVWPGVRHVDVIAPDFYMGYTFGHTPGAFRGWFAPMMADLIAFAREKGKPFGLSEVGFDSDDFAADAAATFAMVKAAPTGVEFINWWQNPAVIDCRLTVDARPAIAKLFQAL